MHVCKYVHIYVCVHVYVEEISCCQKKKIKDPKEKK